MSKNKFKSTIIVLLALTMILSSCAPAIVEEEESDKISLTPDYSNSRYKEIYLAGGCFWGVEAYFERIIGVEYTNVGYANGESDTTNYNLIEETGHAETIYLVYDPEIISLQSILTYFYGIIEPTSVNKQGNDVGTQYRSGIYYVDDDDLDVIQTVTEKEQEKYSGPIATEIQKLQNYVLAEDYHQDYLYKNPNGYCHVDLSNIPSERPSIRASDYPKPSDDEIREKLTDLQYSITQEGATETAFQNPFWNNHDEGLYVDIVTGEPLFLSRDKFDSGSGWPSFTRPIDWNVITLHLDATMGMERIEVKSRTGDTHLGHVFNDGPAEEGGLRFCINSGALDFIYLEEMEQNGYGKYLMYFQ
ncbi:peptide-methionine (R)-S-oxide reductase MsrB [Gudongella sp. DL1XJH-153]|uniref:peptide-methionine (R)-S-oxide reductase MsrB n=1 Tax=Gudongella sp. DL1XJH-153 TaxID=3409804 RepID=UPI003BB63EC1